MIKSRIPLIPLFFASAVLVSCGGSSDEAATEQASDAADSAADATSTAADAATDTASTAADTASDAASTATDAATETASTATDSATDAATSAADTATEVASDATDAASDTAGAVSDSIDPAAWEEIETNWEEQVSSVKEAFPDLTEEEISGTAGKPEELVSLVEQKLSISREEAQARVSEWASSL